MRLQTLMQGQQEGVVTMELNPKDPQARAGTPPELRKTEKVPEGHSRATEAGDSFRSKLGQHRPQEEVEGFTDKLASITRDLDTLKRLQGFQGSDLDPTEVETRVGRLSDDFIASLENLRRLNTQIGDISNGLRGAKEQSKTQIITSL